jgi:putative phosphoesterase
MPIERTAFSDRTSLRVGLISDTHIPEAQPELWPQVFSAFREVDVILHGGDIHELRVLDQLSEVAPTYSARGNGEDGSGGRPIVPEDPRLRQSWVLDLGGVRIGITHDMPIPEHPPNLTVARWKHVRFADTPLDVIVYGHSHVERIDVADATLCVNPGSPTYPHNLQTQLGTIGFLDIDGGWVEASLWQLTDGHPTRSASVKVAVPIKKEAP